MKIQLVVTLLASALLGPFVAAQSVVAKVTKVTAAPSKSLVTIELLNGYDKGLKSYKAMMVLKDVNGKVVDVQSRWLFGSNPDDQEPDIIASKTKAEVNVALASSNPFKQIEIIPTRIILDDGSVITPRPQTPVPDVQKEKK